MTTERIEELWAGDWAGKASGDPFIVQIGRASCRERVS